MVLRDRGLPEKFMVDGDQSLIKRMSEAYEQNAQANQTFWLEGTKDVRFKAGDQNLWNELYTDYPAFQRKKFNFNKIRKIINLIAGHQRRTRKATTILPMDGSDVQTADQFSKVISWVNNTSNAYHTISEAFEGALTTGMNLLSVWMDYRTDPINGEVRLDNLSYNGVMMDQFLTKPDLTDANFMWTRKYLSNELAASLIPARKKEIMEMRGSSRDDKFTFMPENINLQNPNLLAYDEFWELGFREIDLLVDTQSGETMEWTGDDTNLRAFLREFPRVRSQKTQKQTVTLGIAINNRPMFEGPNPNRTDRYPFIPVFGYFEPDVPYFEWKIQGVVRSLRDAQFLYNRRKVIELDILESQINSGMKVMEGSLVDDNDAFLSGQGRGLFIKKTAPLGMASVEPIIPPQIPPSMFQLSESLSKEIMDISGVNEELLGVADDDKAGILAMMRQGAGLTTLETLFDNLDRSQKLLGELTMDMVQANFTPGKIQRIIAEQPSEQFFNKAFQKFDSVVSEGMLTETQRKAHFATKLELVKLGLPVPMKELLKDAPLFGTQSMIEAIQEEQQAAQQQAQKQQEREAAQIQSQINLNDARAIADKGLGLERESRIQENKQLAIERRSQAIENISDARLNRAKTLGELQNLDIESLGKLLEIARTLGLAGPEVETEIKDVEQKTAVGS